MFKTTNSAFFVPLGTSLLANDTKLVSFHPSNVLSRPPGLKSTSTQCFTKPLPGGGKKKNKKLCYSATTDPKRETLHNFQLHINMKSFNWPRFLIGLLHYFRGPTATYCATAKDRFHRAPPPGGALAKIKLLAQSEQRRADHPR